MRFTMFYSAFYEGMHLTDHRIIKYVSFQLPAEPIVVPPKKSVHEETPL